MTNNTKKLLGTVGTTGGFGAIVVYLIMELISSGQVNAKQDAEIRDLDRAYDRCYSVQVEIQKDLSNVARNVERLLERTERTEPKE